MSNNNLPSTKRFLPYICAAAVLLSGAASRCPAKDFSNTQAARDAEKVKHHVADFSGTERMGRASFYASEFAGRKMADGATMDPGGDNAASKTLPLGTTARVTNLQTGKSAVITIEDRGPYVPGRIVDLSPATARQIGLSRREGVALVVVAPIAVPQPNGALKLGSAAREPLRTTTVTKAIRNASVDTRTALR